MVLSQSELMSEKCLEFASNRGSRTRLVPKGLRLVVITCLGILVNAAGGEENEEAGGALVLHAKLITGPPTAMLQLLRQPEENLPPSMVILTELDTIRLNKELRRIDDFVHEQVKVERWEDVDGMIWHMRLDPQVWVLEERGPEIGNWHLQIRVQNGFREWTFARIWQGESIALHLPPPLLKKADQKLVRYLLLTP